MEKPQEQPRSPEQKKKSLRVIYIEDEASFRELTEKEFKKNPDVNITSFSSTEDAMDYLMKLKERNQALPDVIVSDNDLGAGRRKGGEFAVFLKKQGFKIPFVLFAGSSSIMDTLLSNSKEDLEGQGLIGAVNKNNITSLVEVLKGVKST